MLKLIFIRHAESEYNKAGIFAGKIDCRITEEGFNKAKELLKENEKKFDYIYCSPLKRALETLQALIPRSNPIIDERISEICLGEWEGKRKELLDKNLMNLYRIGKYTPIGAETMMQVDTRVCDFVESLFNTYKNNESILIVTHNGIMRAIKRNFVKNYEDITSKNLGTIILTDEDYAYYLDKKSLITSN